MFGLGARAPMSRPFNKGMLPLCEGMGAHFQCHTKVIYGWLQVEKCLRQDLGHNVAGISVGVAGIGQNDDGTFSLGKDPVRVRETTKVASIAYELSWVLIRRP